MFTRFASVAGQNDAAAAAAIAGDDLDILVDLSTHTKGSRPGILARRPARIQITHVASAGTTALSSIDFKLTDAYADIGWDRVLQIEAPLVMDGCVYPWRDIPAPATTSLARGDIGLSERDIVMAAFSVPMKLSRRCVAVWAQILAAVPRARLAFSPLDAALRSANLDITRSAGIAANRVVFVPQGRDDAENQARYKLVDFVLDPMPYGGVNGTLEALAMRVPVVTLVGRRHAERTTYSILANLGVLETVGHTGTDYVEIAMRLATDPAFMHHVRERIGEGLRSSPLTDIRAHTRHLEDAYVRALDLVARGAPRPVLDNVR
jgi:predicted O-linked N-acetylglucosamine transferase (SPINDLY family)